MHLVKNIDDVLCRDDRWLLHNASQSFRRSDTANTISDDEEKNGIFLTFEFKGLGGVGQSADSYLEQAVPGYRNAGF